MHMKVVPNGWNISLSLDQNLHVEKEDLITADFVIGTRHLRHPHITYNHHCAFMSKDNPNNVAAISGFGAQMFDRMHRAFFVKTCSQTRDFYTNHFQFLRSFRLLTLLEHKPAHKNNGIELHRSDFEVFNKLAECSGDKWKAALKAFAARGKNKDAQEAEANI